MMNEHTNGFDAIDDRGRRAAAALHDLLEVEHVAFDAEDTDDGAAVVAFRPRRNPLPFALAAAAAVAVVFAVVFFSTGDDGRSPVASDPAGSLFPSVAPLGLEVIGGTADLGAARFDGQVLFDGDVAIYTADAGMVPPSVAVLTIDGVDSSAQPEDGEAITVQGMDATISTSGLLQSGGGAGEFTIAWNQPGELVVVITSGLSRDESLAVAEGVEFDGGRPTLAAEAVPDGLSLQHRDDLAAVIPLGTAYVLDGGGASVVAFGDPQAENAETIIMSTGPGDRRRVDAVRPFLADQVEVDVRGTTAIAGAPFDETVALTWLEGNNTVVRLMGFGGVTVDDLVAMAESLESVTAAELDSIIDAAPDAVDANIPDNAALEVGFDGGKFYVVIDTAADSIEVGVQTESRGSSTSTALSDFGPGDSLVSLDEDTRVFGVVGSGVARAVVLDQATTIEARLLDIPGHDLKAFMVEGTSSDSRIQLFDAAGNQLDEAG